MENGRIPINKHYSISEEGGIWDNNGSYVHTFYIGDFFAVKLWNDDMTKQEVHYLHRLVAKAFKM